MTVQNKELEVRRNPDGMTYKIAFAGGGEIPQKLVGNWTKKSKAQAAIEGYLAERDTKKVKSSATSKTTGRAK